MKKQLARKIVEEVKKLGFHRNTITLNLDMLTIGLGDCDEGGTFSADEVADVTAEALNEIAIASMTIHDKAMELRKEIG